MSDTGCWPAALAAAVVLALAARACAADGDLKPFVMPALEAPAQPVDLRGVFAGPRGKDLPPVRVEGGHFTAAGRRVRMWGVNLCFAACFPPHDVADRMAARLAAFGVNCVRFHHMDMNAFPRGIWKKDFSGLDGEALDRLDYLLGALKREGVYANINLHVSRDFSRTGSTASKDEVPNFGKKVCIFDPELIALQKQYARDLLDRRNKYTGLRLADDPVVAMVEITNENSVLLVLSRWRSSLLAPRFQQQLVRLWNEFLAGKYAGDDVLARAWAGGEIPRGDEMLQGTDFSKGPLADAWRAQELAGAKMTAEVRDGAIHLNIAKTTDTSWHLQFRQSGLRAEKGRFYTLRFRARADRGRTIGVGLQQSPPPYKLLGLSTQLDLGPEWQSFEMAFAATADEADAKLAFSVGHEVGSVHLAGISLAPGGRQGLRPDESLAKKNVRLVAREDAVTDARKTDFMEFLARVDLRFFTQMREFLRSDLGVKAPITGTEGFTLLSDWVQSHLDYVDGHAYWQHPRFPNRPWDVRDWTIPNTAMVDQPASSTLTSLAFQRVVSPDGKGPARPFTVSEYNHPAPSDTQAECIPMVASFAAAQDWDGVFLFAYSHSDDWTAAAPRSFFDIHASPLKMVQMAAGALVFRRGDVAPLQARAVTHIPPERMFQLAARHGPWTDALMDLEELGSYPALRFFGRAAVVPAAPPDPAQPTQILPLSSYMPHPRRSPKGGPWRWTSAGDVLRWSSDGNHSGIYLARGERSVALVGFAAGRPQQIGPARVTLEAPKFAAITLSSLDGKPLTASKRMLITAAARLENTGQQWNADRTSVGNQWGKAPTLIEPVRARITLKRVVEEAKGAKAVAAQLVALGGDGKPVKAFPVEAKDGELAIALPGDPATLWYVLEIGD